MICPMDSQPCTGDHSSACRRACEAQRDAVNEKLSKYPHLQCEHPGCAQKAVVGLNAVWYCIDHYDEAMARIGRMLKGIVK